MEIRKRYFAIHDSYLPKFIYRFYLPKYITLHFNVIKLEIEIYKIIFGGHEISVPHCPLYDRSCLMTVPEPTTFTLNLKILVWQISNPLNYNFRVINSSS